MGYPKLTYDDYVDNIDYWYGEQGIELPLWASDLAARGYRAVSALDFYDDIFGEDLEPHREPEDYRVGEYAAIALEIVPNGLDERGSQRYVGKRTTVTRELQELYDLIERSDNLCMMSALSYAGKKRTNENARYIHALVIEIDEIRPKSGLHELIYSWQRTVATMPKPTYIVCSGSGVHLYFVFARPVPLFPFIFEQFSAAKTYLTRNFWSSYVTSAWERVQYESVNQPFRCVGSMGKSGNRCAMAFQTGDKITIEDLNKLLPEDLQIKEVYKSKLPLCEAKERYPEWYQRRIVEGKPRGHWQRHPGIYYNWIDKILMGAKVGRRYKCLENLCSLAVQCGIEPERVEADCWMIAERFERMTDDDKNHFTSYDVLCALKTYHYKDEGAYRRRREFVEASTGIPLKENRRNGRNQVAHLARARAVQEIDYPDGAWRRGNGRPKAHETVQQWRRANAEGSKKQCKEATGLSYPTIRKWWDEELRRPLAPLAEGIPENMILGGTDEDLKLDRGIDKKI